MSFSKFAKYLMRNKSALTVNIYISNLNKFKEWLGTKKATPQNIDAYVQYLIDSGASPSKTHLHFWSIKSYFKYLGKGDELNNISLPKIPQSIPKSATKDEIMTLLSCQQMRPMDKAIITILYSCGLRVGELTKLKVHHYNKDKAMLEVTTEKKRSGAITDWVKLEKTAIEALDEHLTTRNIESEYIFSIDGKKPINTETIRCRLKRYCSLMGIRELNPHSFRHSRATQMAKSGMSARQIATYLRQKTETAANKYIHLTAMDISESVPDAFEEETE